MSKIRPHQTLINTLTALSEGNPGALNVLTRLWKEGDAIDPDSIAGGYGAISILDQCGVYGPSIWILYKDICGQSLPKLMGVLRAVQLGFETPDHVYMATQGSYKLDPADIYAQVVDRLPHFNELAGVPNPPVKAGKATHV